MFGLGSEEPFVYTPTPEAGVVKAAIPFFLLAIFFEIFLNIIWKKKAYNIADSIGSIGLGMVQLCFKQMIVYWTATAIDYPYQYVYHHFKVFNVENTWKSNLFVIITTDFLYYWCHRFGHEWNIFWAGHSLHHDSEYFNLSTALRQSAFQPLLFSVLYGWPKAIFGIPVVMHRFHAELNTVLQFWIHTQFIGRLGILEYVINTPYQHKNHHARVPSQCNTNFTGIFPIWDILFGTFTLECNHNRYGIVTPPNTYDPVIPNFRNFYRLFKRTAKYSNIKDKIRVLFYGGRYTYQQLKQIQLEKQYRYYPFMRLIDNIYASIHFLITFTNWAIIVLKFGNKNLNYSIYIRMLNTLLLFYDASSLSAFCGRKYWYKLSELLRLMYHMIISFGFIGILNENVIFSLDAKLKQSCYGYALVGLYVLSFFVVLLRNEGKIMKEA